MDDELSKKLDGLLNSPDGMEKIQSMMAALGISPDALNTAASPEPEPTPPPVAMPELDGLLKLMPLLSQMGRDDQNTTLLKALRPYLHGDREKRLDDSVRMMQLLKFLPLLQKGGTSE